MSLTWIWPFEGPLVPLVPLLLLELEAEDVEEPLTEADADDDDGGPDVG